ncbi:MAG: divalent-cation tolerance protein CutA [Candidatus Poseidoniaceae archaeon]|nr:divalent-cation tolerance protein CutA [Candidatus Poseidoniaceae archaeon]|tara:strand:+ start:137 stop:451 length:315 start_codon:yes stop_codon:yes gene_type:complete
MGESLFIIQTTLPSSWKEFEIGSFSQLLIESGAACVQRKSIVSMYNWDGTIHSTPEWSLEIKVSSSKKEFVLLKIEELHPDDVPQLLHWEVQASQGYADWAGLE